MRKLRLRVSQLIRGRPGGLYPGYQTPEPRLWETSLAVRTGHRVKYRPLCPIHRKNFLMQSGKK